MLRILAEVISQWVHWLSSQESFLALAWLILVGLRFWKLGQLEGGMPPQHE
jgi:hypothetical protein